MRKTRSLLLAMSCALTVFVASCGGGGDEAPPSKQGSDAVIKFEGLYEGTLEGPDNWLRLLVLPSGQIWMNYGTKTGDDIVSRGYARGPSNRSGNSISSLDILDYGNAPGTGISLTATVDAQGVVTGNFQGRAINNGSSAPFSVTLVRDGYEYEKPASNFDIRGMYGNFETASVSISSTNFIVIGFNRCILTGRISPDASDRNFFEVNVTVENSSCSAPEGTPLQGITYALTSRPNFKEINVFLNQVNANSTPGGMFARFRGQFVR